MNPPKIIRTIIAPDTLKWFVGTIAGAVVGSVLLVGWLDARAQGAGANAKAAAHAELEDYKKYNDAQISDLKRQAGRTETKIDALLLNMGIRNPAPAPKDGGP